jgi:hypothetical protein
MQLTRSRSKPRCLTHKTKKATEVRPPSEIYENRLLLHQEHRACTLDFASDFPVKMCRHAGYPPRKDFSAFSHEFLEQIRIFVVDSLCRDIDSTARHDAICPSEVRSAFGVFRFHCLLDLPMQRAAAQERIVFLFLQAAGRVGAFFVTRADVTGDGLTCRFRFCALESNDVPWHDDYSFESVMVSSSSPSPPSSSVKPKREVTGWRTRKAFFCFSI